jgi:glycosyltransferase involved in cell wall biosynthesis
MKVIFVASGNKSVGTVSSFVRSQFQSLKAEGLDMLLFPIRGKGMKSYAKGIVELRKIVRKEHPDVVHAHYSICGIVAKLACLGTKTKVIVSILGSFPRDTFKLHWVRFCIKHVWDATITKSQRTANQLGIDLPVIPNGVNLDQFTLIDKGEAKTMCGFEEDKKYVIWCSNPSRTEKRFGWAREAVELLKDDKVVLLPVYDKTHDEVVKYMCAADVLLLTSEMEGSPNVIKEAMACNCPIVSTDVGDVRWVTEGVQGTYVAPIGDTLALSHCLRDALNYARRTEGRKRIIEYGLTTKEIAKKIKSIYDAI